MASDIESLKRKVYRAAKDGMAITLFAVLCNRSQQVIKTALEARIEEDGQKTTPFLISARNGHDKVVKMLLTNFDVNIEQVGTVKFDGYVIEGATALWCAAGAGHLDVVHSLVEFDADVNHATYSNSTPLRAACFDGRLDIVKYLVEHKADIHIPNKYNNTCLMIACYKGHLGVVGFLLESGANPDAKAHCGATALHFSAERGYLDIVQELMKFNASMLHNDQGMSPLHIAAESSQSEIVEYFISRPETSRVERLEALELLGASFANDKDNYNINKAYQYMWLAMQERFSEENDILLKNVKQPIEAYENRVEAQNVRGLEQIKDDDDAIHMEALIVRERILGENNAEIPHPIIFRGAVFADALHFDRCTALWMRALVLKQRNERSVVKDLLRFAQVFSQMLHLGVEVDFAAALKVLEHNIVELQHDTVMVKQASSEDRDAQTDVYECNIHTALYLLVILTKLRFTKEQEFQLCKLVYRFNQRGLVLVEKGLTPLHMAVDESTVVDDFHVQDVVHFPNINLTRLLVKCGADVNAVDRQGNTPLHVIVKYSKPIGDFHSLHGIIMMLIERGAHLDISNSSGGTPMTVAATGVAEIILRTQGQISLKCIAARAVKKYQVSYQGQLPSTLEEFVNLH